MSARPLADEQARFARELRDFDGSWPGDLLERVVPGGTLDAAAALDVYRRGYVARLTEQLGETYATVWRVLGDDDFLAACEAYIAGHASASYNLSDYGRGFAEFLAASPLARELPFLPELASFELAFHDLFHAEPHQAADVSAAAALAAGGDLSGARLRFGKALRLMDLGSAAWDLFRHRDEEIPPDLDVHRPQRMMLFRQGEEVRALELDAGTFAAIDALGRGRTVDEALEEAVASDAGFGEEQAAQLFAILVSCGVVTDWRS